MPEPDGHRSHPNPAGVAAGVVVVAAVLLGLAVAAPVAAETYWLGALWLSWAATALWVLTRRPLPLAFGGVVAWMLLNVVNGATSAVVGGVTWVGPYVFTNGTVGALELATVAQLSLWAGAAALRFLRPARSWKRWHETLPARRLDRWAIVLLASGVASLVGYVALSGGNPRALIVLSGSSAYGDFGSSTTGSAFKYLLALTSLVGVAMVVATMRLTTGTRRRRLLPIALIVVASGLLIMGGRRSLLVVPGLACGLVWWKTSRSPHTRHLVRLTIVGLVGLFVVAAVVGGLRGQTGSKVVDPQAFVAGELRRGAFAPTAGLMDSLPDRAEMLDGRSYADLLALPIPRAWWADKPEATITSFQSSFMPLDIGASIGFHGELYANFGWLGVVLGCAGFGALIDYVWMRFTEATHLWSLFSLAVAIPVLLQLFSRGYLAGGIAAEFGVIVGTAVVAVLLARLERRLDATQSSSPRTPLRATA